MKKLPIGLQLYTVREQMEKSVSETLARVKAIGYDYVETAGLFGLSGKEFRAELDKAGLTAVSAHVPIETFMGDMHAVISDYMEIGVKYIVIPFLGGGQRYGDEGFEEVYLAAFNEFADICEQNGITLLYHNHDFEFEKTADGKYVLEYIYEKVPKLQSELDVCWVNIGGEEPAEYIKKYAGRCPVIHLKDFVGGKTEDMYELLGTDEAKSVKSNKFAFRPLGLGKQDFAAIIKSGIESGAEYFVVEQDETYDLFCLDAAKISRDYLKTLGF